ncbi:hypothetical protein PG997_010979 [Apiospora hydei]|uniref:Uncharacterized protein n=1 Tax=Apiospora hydei TaxID=1337664 RepID=A0ABR1VKF4_9PEZI
MSDSIPLVEFSQRNPTLQPGTDRHQQPIQHMNQNGATLVRPEDSFYEWVCRIALNLETQQHHTLQLVTARENLPGPGSNYPRHCSTLLENRDYARNSCVKSFGSFLPPLKTPWASSLRLSKASKEPIDSSGTILWGHDSTLPGNLDPSRGDYEILLTWRRQVTKFESDLIMYIWEYHKTMPEVEYAKIILRPSDLTQQPLRLIISFRSSRSNQGFTKIRGETTEKATAYHSGAATADCIEWSPLYEALVSICMVFELMITDTSEFLDICHNENRLGRQNPSTSKMRFLMHLDDCCKVAHQGVQHGLEVLDTLRKWAQESQIAPTDESRLEVLKGDLRYLDEELEKLRSSIRHEKDMLRQYFQLSSDMTGFRLTLLAGIFLPLSFTTSIFGMNIKTPTPEGLQGFSDFTNQSLSGLQPEVLKPSQALISSIAMNGPLTHGWTTFAVASLCILATLPLTLTIGWTLRKLVVLSAKYVVYWRVTLVVFGVPFVVISMFGRLFGEDFGVIILLIFWAFNGILVLYLLGTSYRAWAIKHGRVFGRQ